MTSLMRASLGDAPFTIDDVDALASGPATLTLSDTARSLVAESRAVVERYAAGDEPVYGLNTGLGANVGFRVARSELEEFQEQLVRGRTIGVGEPLPERVCRAALIVRCVGLARGGAGISPSLLDLLLAMVERGVTPVIPRRGSIGASDLGLAAHIAAVAIGRGEAWYENERLPGGEALAAAGLAPARLGVKDGHALCNTSAVSVGHAALTLADASRVVLFAVHAAALAAEGYGANPSIFDARIAKARPAARQVDAAALFRRLLDGSSLNDPGRRSADPGSALVPLPGADRRRRPAGSRRCATRGRGRARRDGRQPDRSAPGRPDALDRELPHAGDRARVRHALDRVHAHGDGQLPPDRQAARSRPERAAALPVAGRRRLGRLRAGAEALRRAAR